ncbi:NADH-quinone oxidoreductase subunit N [Anaerolineales bacterium HSG6]|nr:NADH-quinone oxidoreductase subunit N [Anaerolineales bacterium HSG6]MDM8530094.1 NADH-quinone oxidoreductase subunit N [Anaerolineales bacterium HSG25]
MPIEFPVLNFFALSPIIVVIVLALVVMFMDMLSSDKTVLGYLTVFGLFGALMPCVPLLNQTKAPTFQNMVVSDGYAVVFYIIFIVTALLSSLIALTYLENRGMQQGEYYILILLSTSGMMLMAASTDLIVTFLGLEIMSIALYVLAGFNRRSISSGEAGLKYFLLGAFASAFFLYGVAFIYGATGSTNIHEIGGWFSTNEIYQSNPIALVGLALLIIGFAFKVAAVPFHWWTPDVYHGAPTSATAFMAVGAKAAGFAALVRILAISFGGVFTVQWQIAISLLAVITMTSGNIAALAQKDVKRMLAYSSIAHAGYLLVGVAALPASNELYRVQAVSGLLFYLMSYAFMNIGAFAVVALLEKQGKIGTKLSDYTTLSTRQPFVAFVMLLFMFSLTGIPPFIGFWGKWYIFWAAVDANLGWLAAIGMINSAISAFYYLSVVVQMYMHTEQADVETTPIALPAPIAIAVTVTAMFTLLFGLWPTPLINLMSLAVFG